jgi:hypothetical protein
MQLEALRRDRDTLGKIQAAIVAKGGPPDLAAAADEMIRSGKPDYITQGQAIRQKLADQLAFTNYQKEFGPKAPGAAPTGMPAPMPEAGSFAADTAARRAALPVNAFAAPVNALAPAAAPAAPVAPVNAMVGQPDIAALEARYRRVANLETPGAKAEAALLLKQIDRAATATPADIKTMQALGYPITQAGFAAFRDAQRPDRLLTPEEEAQRIRVALASRPPAQPAQPVAPTITTVEDPTNPGKFLQVDARVYRGGGANAPGVIGGARPSAAAEKTATQRAQMSKDLGFAITQLSDITKDGGLIDQSTGSGAGRLADVSAGFFGKATEGAIAIGKIAPIADLVLKMVPRFEGPQSNKDTQSYKEAAGQLADATLPTKIRKEAGKTVLRLMQERKNQFVTSDMATQGAGPNIPAPPAGFTPDQ